MRFATLNDWLAWQETLHPRAVDLGLERVCRVARAMGLTDPPYAVVTVAGTNGKGSSVAFLETILGAAGWRVGAYTSPHLLRYTERIRVHGAEVAEPQLCRAFDRVDQARGGISLTYFEFGTLAALEIFSRAGLDVAVLEVGMGGRLDAVNVVDADVALVTSVGIDHTEWLGQGREAIGWEKAGIFRAGRAAVCSDPRPPARLVSRAASLGTNLRCLGPDFNCAEEDAGRGAGRTWSWWSATRRYQGLPSPALAGRIQLQNAAGVLMALELLEPRIAAAEADIRHGLVSVRLPGRFQVLPGPVDCILDVAHNPDAARVLAQALRERPRGGAVRAVVGMLGDKDIEGVLGAMLDAVQDWYLADLDCARGAPAERLRVALAALGAPQPVRVCGGVGEAFGCARAAARTGDTVVVFGSFHTVAEAMASTGGASAAANSVTI